MPRILACTDGSLYAASVYDHAAWAARGLGASVEVLHVLDPRRDQATGRDFSGNMSADIREDLLTSLAELDAARNKVALTHGRAVLEDAETRLRQAGVAAVTLTQRHGSLVETLAEAESRADLVVIGKRGEAADFAAGHLGANLERVVRASTKPILVASRAFKPIERLLVAYDGGPSTRRALDLVAESPLLKTTEVHLLTVGPAKPDLQERLAVARERLAAAGIATRARLIEGEPETVIGQYVLDEAIGLMVVGAYGHSRIRHLIVGSTTTALVRACQIPLIMIR
jgi:nucleotide-binding universal stress UspA family protein